MVVTVNITRKFLPKESYGTQSINNFQYITEPTRPNGIVSGGNVVWLTGYSYVVSPAEYYINNTYRQSFSTTLILEAAHATLDRVDVLVLDDTGSVVVLKGTEAANPQKPTVNPATQLEVTYIYVKAASTAPDALVNEIIYDENVEWTGSVAGTGTAGDFNSTTLPYTGNKCADISLTGAIGFVKFLRSSVIDVKNYTVLSFVIKLKEIQSSLNAFDAVFSAGTVYSSTVVAIPVNFSSTEWQVITIPLTDFQLANLKSDTFTLRLVQDEILAIGFYLDNITLQTGVSQPAKSDIFVTSFSFVTDTGVLSITQNDGLPALTALIGGQKDVITAPASHSIDVTFATAFVTMPKCAYLNVYRWVEMEAGKWIKQNVLHYFSSTTWISAIGFAFSIDSSEALTGVIIEYKFE